MPLGIADLLLLKDGTLLVETCPPAASLAAAVLAYSVVYVALIATIYSVSDIAVYPFCAVLQARSRRDHAEMNALHGD